MAPRWLTIIFTLLWTVGLLPVVHAQTGGRQDAMNILNGLPPDLYVKIQSLAKMVDQSIKAGQLTDAEIQQGMISGHLGEKLKTVNPEAGRLFDEITDSMKSGKGPGEES